MEGVITVLKLNDTPKEEKISLINNVVQAQNMAHLHKLLEMEEEVVDVNVADEALISAVEHANHKATILLCEQGASVNQFVEGEPILTYSIKHNSFEFVKLLIKAGADVNLMDSDREESPLTAACVQGKLTCIKALLAAGADVNQTNCEEETPLSRLLNDIRSGGLNGKRFSRSLAHINFLR